MYVVELHVRVNAFVSACFKILEYIFLIMASRAIRLMNSTCFWGSWGLPVSYAWIDTRLCAYEVHISAGTHLTLAAHPLRATSTSATSTYPLVTTGNHHHKLSQETNHSDTRTRIRFETSAASQAAGSVLFKIRTVVSASLEAPGTRNQVVAACSVQ
ncbi:hypothetical protein B0H65DRAFT_444791 [Neurospora tetraspora]|uniref:Uncharacterized protein n=1 Tax=Neurospora tetraspora TaxID=94610 RepID=A0AAE0JBG5_9PEZI|nr:hypothetical protein B0H65DRAFT_444791 [Neurospora tetraspora]